MLTGYESGNKNATKVFITNKWIENMKVEKVTGSNRLMGKNSQCCSGIYNIIISRQKISQYCYNSRISEIFPCINSPDMRKCLLSVLLHPFCCFHVNVLCCNGQFGAFLMFSPVCVRQKCNKFVCRVGKFDCGVPSCSIGRLQL